MASENKASTICQKYCQYFEILFPPQECKVEFKDDSEFEPHLKCVHDQKLCDCVRANCEKFHIWSMRRVHFCYESDECKKRFILPRHLTRHKNEEHVGWNLKEPFICPFCKYNCDAQLALNMHIRYNHEDQEQKTKAEQETEKDDGMSDSNEIKTEKSASGSSNSGPSPHRILENSSDPFLTEVANISAPSSPIKFTED